jgi:1,4-alpha-glucan branching enzyme
MNVINYIDNHDQTRIMQQLGNASIFDDAAFRRIKMGMSILMTAPGTPMLWMGSEFGMSHERGIEPHPLDWDLLRNHRNMDLKNHVSGLVHLRKNSLPLQSETFEVIHATDKLLAYKRWTDDGRIVIVVWNICDEYLGEIAVPNWPEGGIWHEYIYDYDVEVGDGTLHDFIGESEVKIYVKK